MNEAEISPEGILDFWFGASREDPDALAAMNAVWFGNDVAFDARVRAQFSAHVARAADGEFKRWKLTPSGTLALILTFDQFPRNIFRSMPEAFAYDTRALALSRDGVAMGVDGELGIVERAFFYMPFEHAEDIDAQDRSVECFERLHADAGETFREMTQLNLRHAHEHHALIRQFGRFPHRNLVLGRDSTPAEIAWIAEHRGAYGQG